MQLSCCTVSCSRPLAPTRARRPSTYVRTHRSVAVGAGSGTYLFEVQGDAGDDRPTSYRSEEAILRRYRDLLRDSGVIEEMRARKRRERPRDKRRRAHRELVAQRKWERDNQEWRPETLASAGGEGQTAEPFADVFSLHNAWATPEAAAPEPPLLFDALDEGSSSQAAVYVSGGYLPQHGKGGQRATQWLNDPNWQGGYLEDLPLAAATPAAAATGTAGGYISSSAAATSTWGSGGDFGWGPQAEMMPDSLAGEQKGAGAAGTGNGSTQHLAGGGGSSAAGHGVTLDTHLPERAGAVSAAAAGLSHVGAAAADAAVPIAVPDFELWADACQGTAHQQQGHQEEQAPSLAGDLRRAFSPDMMLWEERAAEASAHLAAAAAVIADDAAGAYPVPQAAAAAVAGQDAGAQAPGVGLFEEVADAAITGGDEASMISWEVQQQAEVARRAAVMQQQLQEYAAQQRAMQQQEQEEQLAAPVAAAETAREAWGDGGSEQHVVVLAGLTSPAAQVVLEAASGSTSTQPGAEATSEGTEQHPWQQQVEAGTWQVAEGPWHPSAAMSATPPTDAWQAKEAALLEKEQAYTARIQDLASYEHQLEEYHQQLLAYQQAQEQYWSDVAAAAVGAAAAGAAAGQDVVSAASAAQAAWEPPGAAQQGDAMPATAPSASTAASEAAGTHQPAAAAGEGVTTSQPRGAGSRGKPPSTPHRRGASKGRRNQASQGAPKQSLNTTAAAAGASAGKDLQEQPLRLPSVAVAAAVRDAQAVTGAVDQVLAAAAQLAAATGTQHTGRSTSGVRSSDVMGGGAAKKPKARAGKKAAKLQQGSAAR